MPPRRCWRASLRMRARRVAAAKTDAFSSRAAAASCGATRRSAQLEAADDPLKPTVSLLADEHLSGPDREKVQARLETWLTRPSPTS